MKIALAQLNYHVGNFNDNISKIIKATEEAIQKDAAIVCFGELAICGYPPRDFLEFNEFIEQAHQTIEQLYPLSDKITIILGIPTINPVPEGKDLFNSGIVIQDGKIVHTSHKALLPTYDIFDEYRYFEPASSFSTFVCKGKRIALTICEDIWNVGYKNPLYKVIPMDELIQEKPDIMINLSASPFNYKHAKERIRIAKENVKRYGIPMFYVNHVGAQTEIIFDGGSLVISPDTSVYREMPYWQEGVEVFDLDDVLSGNTNNEQPKEEIALIYEGLVEGIKNYFKKSNFSKAILGLSGGIDSALTCVLLADALGPQNVMGLIMPSEFSSQHSVDDALALAKNLGVKHEVIPIADLYNQYLTTLQPAFEGLPFNVTEENLQARIRGMLLMAYSNKFGNILLNTTNKSEMAVGYGTLYGDLCGGLSILGDVYKTQVYELSNYINRSKEIIPSNTIHKAPSAELRPDQKDSDSLPEYNVLDKILYAYIEERKGTQEIIDLGYDEKLVHRILRMVNMNEFKRYQTAPVLRVSPKAFGMGRRMPIVAKYLS